MKLVWAARSRPPLRKGRWIGGLQPSKTEGSLPLIPLELLSCFQPLSHPRYARLTAPLDNGSHSLRSCLERFRKAFLQILSGRKQLFGLRFSASPESGEVARRGKAAATEGLFSLALISF